MTVRFLNMNSWKVIHNICIQALKRPHSTQTQEMLSLLKNAAVRCGFPPQEPCSVRDTRFTTEDILQLLQGGQPEWEDRSAGWDRLSVG